MCDCGKTYFPQNRHSTVCPGSFAIYKLILKVILQICIHVLFDICKFYL